MNPGFLAVLLGFLLAYVPACLRCVHIFQLNGYKHAVHKRWYFDNLGPWLARTVWPLGGVALYLWRGASMYWAAAALLVVTGVLCLPWKKAKKPLVYTARVRRLGATLLLFYALCVLLACTAPNAEPFFTMVFCVALPIAPYIVLLGDTVNSPVEKAINRRYIRQAREILAACPDLRVIGVTGSYGKTSMKFFLETLLRARYNVLATPASYNTTLGVVRTVRESLRATHEVFICEMGARKPGDIREICELVHPQYGVVTSIGAGASGEFRYAGKHAQDQDGAGRFAAARRDRVSEHGQRMAARSRDGAQDDRLRAGQWGLPRRKHPYRAARQRL